MTTSSATTFAALLRRLRLAAGLTQEELAERAGLSARGVQDLERGVRLAPRPETVRLLVRALDLDEAARAAFMAAALPDEAATPVHGAVSPRLPDLPRPPTAIVGREHEVAAACTVLRRPEVRLLTLTGPGGVGKTRLAQAIAAELASDFRDGVAWVDLAALRDPGLVADAVARGLGVRESAERPLADVLALALAERQLLLVLDNCEHLLPAMPLVAEFLAACPHLVVMATSRARLRLRGERELPVGPLTVPAAAGFDTPPLAGLAGVAAVRLFVERVQAVVPGFALTAESAAPVAEICRRLEGLPLALELAAARVKLLPPPALLARLERRLPLLSDGPRDAPDRQRTMRDAIAWSHDLLTTEEQVLFRRLAIFAGGFTLEAAEWVAGVGSGAAETESGLPASTLNQVGALIDQSLLRPSEPRLPRPEGAEPRFALLETVREYARERLAASGEEATICQAHAASFLTLAERAEPELTGPDETVWLDRLEVEHDNLRQALAWAIAHEPSLALRLVGALWRFWWVRGYLREGRTWAEAALAHDGGNPAERARALHVAGDLAQEQGDYARARPLLVAGRDAAQAAGEPAVAALCLSGLGFISRNQGAYEEAESWHGQALALQREIGDRRAIACTLANLGSIAQNRGEAARAETLFAEALATFHALGEWPMVADVSTNLAILANQEGDHARACRLAEEALSTYRTFGDRQAAATALVALANAARGQEDRSRATALYAEALDLFRGVDHQRGVASVLIHLATVALDEANTELALQRLAESLRTLQRTGDKPAIAPALAATARAAGTRGRWAQAIRLAEASAVLREAQGAFVPRSEAEALRQLMIAATAALEGTIAASAVAAGRALPLEQAMAEALAIADELGATAPR